ncbi:rhodanese-like domain-containing protein [Melaminivora jejuensis]
MHAFAYPAQPLPAPQPMRVLLRSLFLCCLLLAGGAMAAQPLLSPRQLAAQQQQGVRLVVLDVRDAPAYALQHIPGALSAPYGRWRSGPDNPGALLPLPVLTQLVQELGLTSASRVVVAHAGADATDFGAAARVYWTLKSLGVAELSILDGGLAAWKQAGLPLEQQPVAAPRSQWQPEFSSRWLATREQVQTGLGDSGVLRVDSRPARFYEGRIAHDAARARGTLPGAVNLDSERLFELEHPVLLDKAALQDELDSLGAAPDQPVVAFCNTGHWAATDWFVLSEVLGRPEVRLYPGSMVDWTRASTPLPMDNEPGRWQQLRYTALSWAHRNLGTQAP